MAKRPNQMAWGLAAVLAAVLLGGLGLLLTRGISYGNVTVKADVQSPIRFFGPGGSEEGPFGGPGCWAIPRSYNFRFFEVVITRTYYQELPPKP